MDFKKHIEAAWHTMLTHIASLIIMTLVMAIISICTLLILTPVMMAGYMQAIVLMMRNGREPTLHDLFSQMRLFLPLLGFTVIAVFAAIIGFHLLVLPGFVISFGVAFTCIYMLPLMTDQNLGLVQAFMKSWQMATQDNITDHIVVVILFLGLMTIGGIGFLFTQPFATVFLISIYLERLQTSVSKTE